MVLVNIDNGSVSTSCSDTLHLPEIPPAAADCFTQRFWHFLLNRSDLDANKDFVPPDRPAFALFCRCVSLRIHFDLHQCHQASCTDISEQRAQRRAWQQSLNHQIQRIALELLVNIFRLHASSSPTSSSARMMVSAFGV